MGFIHKIVVEHQKKVKSSYAWKNYVMYLNNYYDFNFVTFYDEIIENEKYKYKYKISYSSLYNEFLNNE